MTEELTPWFPPQINPVREGWYETKGCRLDINLIGRRYWNGKWWSFVFNVTEKSAHQSWQWRGLATPPAH